MRHTIRSVVVAGASALLLTAGAGTASAQGSLQFALPLPLDIPGLASLFGGADPLTPVPATADATADEEDSDNLSLVPAELADRAFEGTVVAGINEARTAVGAERLITSPDLENTARERAAQLADGDANTGDLSVPGAESAVDRTTLELPARSTPPNVLTALLADTGMRERMLNGEFTHVGAGLAVAEDGGMHLVLDFA